MANASSLHSDSWFRLASQRLALRPHIRVFRQRFRGERWFVLHDPFNNNYFRLRPAAWDFVARLSLDRTVDAVWAETTERDPLDAPGQEEVLKLLAQIYRANLLHSTIAPDTAKLFERYRKRRQRETRAYLQNIMFARIPLLDPDGILKPLVPAARRVFSKLGAVVWLGVVLAAVKVAIDHSDALLSQAQGVLAPDNLAWLYLGLVSVKLVHEFGHAIVCRRYGGEVHTMGIMFLLFTPVPYMDATSSWSFRSRWHRALVGGAGMICELLLAALATFVWAQTAPGVVNSVAYNIMFVASVSTVLFNANPLLRFDGYYIFSDLLDIPNLHQRATLQVTQAVETRAFGVRGLRSPARSAREAGWLTAFAVCSHVYRLILFATILLFLADHFLILGVILTIVCAFTWLVLPVIKFGGYLLTSPRLERVRPRAMMVSGTVIGTLLLLVGLVPWPNHFRAPGVIEAVEHSVVAPDTPGRLVEILVPNGTRVLAGTALIRLENPELALELAEAQAQVEETRVRELRALQQQTADLAPLASRLASLQHRQADLEARTAALVVRATHPGLWVAPRLMDAPGAWLERGLGIGQVINDGAFRFTAVVSQAEASRLFEGAIHDGEVRLPGVAGRTLRVVGQTIIPADRDQLPAPALGWRSGGSVPVRADDSAGTRAAEPFFEVRAVLAPAEGNAVLHGRSGWLRYSLPPEPLFNQLYRSLRQLLQKRYGL